MDKKGLFDAKNQQLLAESIEIAIKKIQTFQNLCELVREKMINILENMRACYCGKVYREFRPSKKDLRKLIEILFEIGKLESTTINEYNYLDKLSKVVKVLLRD